MSNFRLTDEQIASFHQDGFLILRKFFEDEKISLLHKIAKADQQMETNTHNPVDSQGKASKLRLRNDLPEDIYSAFVRCDKIVDSCEALLQEEVYHFHHKMMLKEPRVGGAWEWHQDYGYWYKHNHCLFPNLISVMIAVDKATEANGCLQVLRGSHKCGRIEHGVTGSQTGADLERVEQLKKHLDLIHVELEPGDTLFFHSNLLHSSDANLSDHARWTLIGCYNAKSNSPYQPTPNSHPCYSYLERWPEGKILEIGHQQDLQMQSTGRS